MAYFLHTSRAVVRILTVPPSRGLCSTIYFIIHMSSLLTQATTLFYTTSSIQYCRHNKKLLQFDLSILSTWQSIMIHFLHFMIDADASYYLLSHAPEKSNQNCHFLQKKHMHHPTTLISLSTRPTPTILSFAAVNVLYT